MSKLKLQLDDSLMSVNKGHTTTHHGSHFAIFAWLASNAVLAHIARCATLTTLPLATGRALFSGGSTRELTLTITGCALATTVSGALIGSLNSPRKVDLRKLALIVANELHDFTRGNGFAQL